MRRFAVAAALISILLLIPGCRADDPPAVAAGAEAAAGEASSLGHNEQTALVFVDPATTVAFAEAIAHARLENQRVLVQWGSAASDRSAALGQLLGDNRDVARKLRYGYQVSPVEVSDADQDIELLGRHGGAVENLPHLAILDADGQLIANRDGASLMAGDEFDAEAILGFLDEHQADYWQAGDILGAALAEAERTERMVFLHTGAPW